MFLQPMNEQDLGYEGFFDGTQEIVPDETVLNCVVIDGFNGIEEGKAQSVCFINVSITTPGQYFGFKFKYNAKIYHNDANKRDQAFKNLGLLDAQAGFPMTKGQLELSTENINQYWSMTAEAQVKIGMMIQKENMDGTPILDENDNPTTKSINFVRGFGYLREKMRTLPQQPTQQTQAQEPAYNQPEQTQPVDYEDDDLDF